MKSKGRTFAKIKCFHAEEDVFTNSAFFGRIDALTKSLGLKPCNMPLHDAGKTCFFSS